MLSNASSVTPKPAAMPPAAPAAQPALPTPGSAGGPTFAQFLNDQPNLPPAHPDPVPRDPDTAGEAKTAAPAPAANTAPARRKDGNASATKPAQGRPSEATDTAKPVKDAKVSDDKTEAADAASASDKDPETSGLDEFTQLIGLAVPPQTAGPQPVTPGLPGAADAVAEAGGKGVRALRTGREADDATTRGDATESTATSSSERRPSDSHARAADTPHAKGIELAADKAAAARSDSSQALQTATATPSEAAPRAAAVTDVAAPNFAAVLAQAMPATAAAADTAPVGANGQVNAAVHSSAFAPELGARVSLLAVDGVQQAELQLNPSDMGPVAVQIVVDGNQAQVSFHAAQAETRQALEQSLPDLAAALQNQGLTLSGGGVFQQAPRDAQGGDAEAGRDEGRSSRSGSGTSRIGASAGVAAAPVRRSVGLLDTFA
ncbi:flagellar hook-length control protein FliK [Roseateles sp. NT4]|uniref:flagellar hook-length control protein FliK n=1 Tax=Roseateles sp. NT4 TaxID=3453715 RepID=UPI003EE9DB9B